MCGFMSSSRRVFTAAYAVSGSNRPGSMMNTFMNEVSCGGVTSVQCSPPSAVVATTPSSVPIQMRLISTYDGPMV